jgi:predicted hydrocarbon binding protein
MEAVMGRLPEYVKLDILNNTGLQILADENLLKANVVHFEFDYLVKYMVCLNTNLLKESAHQIIYTIVHEIAYYVLRKEKSTVNEKEIQNLIKDWGFGKELEAVRYNQAVSESGGYKIGYEWARKQNKEYLLLHFSLYFDEWNEKGLGRLSTDQLEKIQTHIDAPSILNDLTRSKHLAAAEFSNAKSDETFSLREEILAGVMAAVKEIKFNAATGVSI